MSIACLATARPYLPKLHNPPSSSNTDFHAAANPHYMAYICFKQRYKYLIFKTYLNKAWMDPLKTGGLNRPFS